MKKLTITLSLFLIFAVCAFSQGLHGFFTPVKHNPYFNGERTADRTPSLWLVRMSGQVNALAFYYDKDAKAIKTLPFAKIGFGIGYVRYKDIAGVPETNLSINALLLTDVNDPTVTKITVGATIKSFNLIEFGLAYDFGLKRPELLTGLSYTF